jgi:hypothetical protein
MFWFREAADALAVCLHSHINLPASVLEIRQPGTLFDRRLNIILNSATRNPVVYLPGMRRYMRRSEELQQSSLVCKVVSRFLEPSLTD